MSDINSRIAELRAQMAKIGGGFGDRYSHEDIYPEDIISFDNISFDAVPTAAGESAPAANCGSAAATPAVDPVFRTLDLYRPKASEASGGAGNGSAPAALPKLPVILSVHGGGWIMGEKDSYRPYCCTLAREGFAVIAINYHLTPEAQFPVPLEDVNMAFTWVLAHADEYGLDTEHIFAVGDSAGAHLLSLYTCFLTNGQYTGRFSFRPPEGLKILALGLNCGQFDIRPEERNDKDPAYEVMEAYLPGGATDENLLSVCVTDHMTKNFPPCHLVSGTGDFLFPQQLVMEKALAKRNIPFEFRFCSQGSRQLGHVFHLNVTKEVSREANRAQCEFFKAFL